MGKKNVWVGGGAERSGCVCQAMTNYIKKNIKLCSEIECDRKGALLSLGGHRGPSCGGDT